MNLIDRQFVVNVPLEIAWQHMARVEQWPTWARHIKRVELHPEGELGPHSSGVIHLANGMRSTFRMTEYNPGHNWKWVGPFLWLTIEYDHVFQSLNSDQTKLRFVVDARGFAVGLFGRLFAKIYKRNLEKAIPRLVDEMNFSAGEL
jgi:uncharacterized membrane protein